MIVGIAAMTPQQLQLCMLLLEGLSNAEIVKRSGRGKLAIKQAMHGLFKGFNIISGHKRVRLAIALYQMGLCKSCSGGLHDDSKLENKRGGAGSDPDGLGGRSPQYWDGHGHQLEC